METENKKIELTKNELKILHYLVLNQGKIVSREDIMNYLWESENFIDDNTCNHYYWNIRCLSYFFTNIITFAIW